MTSMRRLMIGLLTLALAVTCAASASANSFGFAGKPDRDPDAQPGPHTGQAMRTAHYDLFEQRVREKWDYHRHDSASDLGIEHEIDGDTLTLTLAPQKGKVAKFDVRAESSDGVVREVLEADSIDGEGIDISRVRISENGWVSFYFADSLGGRRENGSVRISDSFYVTFEQLMPGDEITLCCLLQRHLGHVGGSVKLEVVPEPSVLSLLGLGAGALAVWRRRPGR